MATAKKLKSGSWRCLVYDYTDENGKRKYRSFTSSDTSARGKREAEFLAAEYAAKKEKAKKNGFQLTFKDALERYISSRESVLSAGTIREYTRSKNSDFHDIENMFISDITQEDIQRIINDKAKKCSPKTVRNMHGLISAVFREYNPTFKLTTSLPQKKKPDLYIPNETEIKKLMSLVADDKDMQIAVLLAAFGPMRRGEICGLRSDDIENGIIHVRRSVILDKNGEWIIKDVPKTEAGDRLIPLPDFVLDLIKDIDGQIVHLHPNNITDRFTSILERSDMKHFRFHDLRHYCASILHAIGIPDAYIMQRGGWESDTVLKQVYRHALSEESVKMNNKANKHFSSLYNTKCNTK